MKFQSTNSSVVKLFWMISMMIFELSRNGEVVWRELVAKVTKRKQFWAIFRGCTGTGTGLYRYRYRAVPV